MWGCNAFVFLIRHCIRSFRKVFDRDTRVKGIPMVHEKEYLSLDNRDEVIKDLFVILTTHYHSIFCIDVPNDAFFAFLQTATAGRHCGDSGTYSEMIRLFSRELVFPEDRERFEAALSVERIRQDLRTGNCEVEYRLATPERRWQRTGIIKYKNDNSGDPLLAVLVSADIHDAKKVMLQQEEALEAERFKFRMLAELSRAVVVTYDTETKKADGCGYFSSPEGPKMVHREWTDIRNEWKALIHPEHYTDFFDFFFSGVNDDAARTILCRPVAAEEPFRWHRVKVKFLKNVDGTVKYIVAVLEDVDHEKREALKAQKQSTQDLFTNLYNKQAFASEVCRQLEADGDKQAALLLFDLDRFKHVNDTYGHIEGDKVIQQTAHILKTSFRSGDLVGRMGGDEFGVFCRHGIDRDLLVARVKHIGEQFARIVFPDQSVVTCSVGIAFSRPGKNFETLYKEADTALYRRKKGGRNGYTFYEEAGN